MIFINVRFEVVTAVTMKNGVFTRRNNPEDTILRFLSSYLILPVALGPGVYSASNRNEYQKHKNNVSGE
jgi:hypothetical protein